MAMTPSKRRLMETTIYTTFTMLDPTGANTAKYKTMFKGMTDAQFDKFFKDLFATIKPNDPISGEVLPLDIVDFERTLRMDYIEAAAKYLGVELYEYVALPYNNMDKENPVVTKHKVPVGPIHIKRLQQLRAKKNTTSIEDGKRSALTGQVTGADKNSRENDSEASALVTIGANETLREFMGPRADDMVMKMEMDMQISTNGYVDLDTLTNKVENKTTLSTVDMFFLCMGIKTDLITEGLILKSSLK